MRNIRLLIAVCCCGSLCFADPILNEDTGISYELFSGSGEMTWDEVVTLAATKTYDGMIGQLVEIDSQATVDFLTSKVVMGWSIGWVGAYRDGEDVYNTDGSDFADISVSVEDTVTVGYGYGVALKGSAYNGILVSVDEDATPYGDYIVQYVAVPEPGTMSLVLVAAAVTAFVRRRFFR